MPIVENGETYYTAAEAARYLSISRDTFYRSVRDGLQAYQFGVLKRTFYKLSDLQSMRGIRPVEPQEEK